MVRPRVLAVDGGGIRGELALQVLRYIERKTGKPAADSFDMVAGTSTGAIIALALTSPNRQSADAIDKLYQEHAGEIFSSWTLNLDGLLGPKYQADGLERLLQHVLGSATLAQARCATLVTTYDLTARLPLVLGSYNAHSNMLAWQAARASSAGPTFFEPAGSYVDGGMVVNNPALLAAIEASKLFGCKVEDCTVLSLGTGAGEDPIDPATAASWGEIGWLRSGALVSMFTDGVSDLVDLEMSHLLPPEQYLRLQCRLSGPVAAMDNVAPANLLALRQLGNQLVGQRLAEVDAMIARLAR